MGTTSSGVMDQQLYPAVPIKIVTFNEGKFNLDVSKFEEIFLNIPKTHEKATIVFISVIGQPKSGKSFLANLALHYLINKGKGNWMQKLKKKEEKLVGFDWDKITPQEKMSGCVSIWAQPFLLKNGSGEKTILLILDSSINDDDHQVQQALEVFVWLICPNVIINQKNDLDLNFLTLRKKLLDAKPDTLTHKIFWVLQNVVEKSKDISLGKLSEKKIRKYVDNLSKVSGNNGKDLWVLWEEIEDKTVFALPKPGNPPILDVNGFISLNTNFTTHVQNLMNAVIDAEEIHGNANIQPGNVVEFLKQSVHWLNANLRNVLSTQSNNGNEVTENGGLSGNNQSNGNRRINSQIKSIEARTAIMKVPKDEHRLPAESNLGTVENRVAMKTDEQITTQNSTSQNEPTRDNSAACDSTTSNLNDNAQLLHLFQSIKDETLKKHGQNLDAYLQNQNCTITSIEEFHKSESSKIMAHLNSIWQQKNIPNSTVLLQWFQGGLDVEYSKRVEAIAKKIQKESVMVYTQDDVDTALTKNAENVMSLIIDSSNHTFNQYDQAMENYCKQQNTSIEALHGLHNGFLHKYLSQEYIWNSYFRPVFPIEPDPQFLIKMRDHIHHHLQNRLQYYDGMLRNKLYATSLQTELVNSYTRTFEFDLKAKLFTKIEENGFTLESVKQLVTDTQNELMSNVVKHFNNEGMTRMIQAVVTPITDRVTTFLQHGVETYQKTMTKNFQKQACFSEKKLNFCHEGAVNSTTNSLSRTTTTTDNMALMKTALNFAKQWNISRNEDIRKSLKDAAHLALETLEHYYHQEMKYILASGFYSKRKLTDASTKLKNECIAAFRKAMPFYCEPDKYGIEDYSTDLESKIDKLFNEYLQSNEKQLADGLKSVQAITTKAMKSFTIQINDKISAKCVTNQEFELIFNQMKTAIISQMKQEINTQVPNENCNIHQINLENQILILEKEMRETNEGLQRQQIDRGCNTPTLCIEFGLDVIRVGYFNSEGNFQFVPNPADKQIDIKNTLTFLDTDEVVLGEVEVLKLKNVEKEIHLEQLLNANPNQSKDVLPKELKFRGEIMPTDLEFLCSILFSKLKENAENVSGEKFSSTVISVPMRFHSRLRHTIMTSTKIAGFEEIFLINDTTATALQYFKKQSGNSCLVVSAGVKNFDIAIYNNNDGKLQMEFSCSDRNFATRKPNRSYSTVAASLDGNVNVTFQSLAIEAAIKSKKKFESTILVCDTQAIIEKCSRALEKTKTNFLLATNDDKLPSYFVLNGLGEYSQKLKQNILQAKSAITDLTTYSFVCDDTRNEYQLPPSNSQTGASYEHIMDFKNNGETTFDFYELAGGNKIRFAHGKAQFTAKRRQAVNIKVSVSNEGIFNVQLISEKNSIPIIVKSISEDQCNQYAAIIEKLFKKDPKVEAIAKAKLHLKTICQDMKDRFSQILVKSDMTKDVIRKDIENAIDLANNPNVDLQTLEQKTKTMEVHWEKKFPKI